MKKAEWMAHYLHTKMREAYISEKSMPKDAKEDDKKTLEYLKNRLGAK